MNKKTMHKYQVKFINQQKATDFINFEMIS